eukprot:gene13716-29172_t
MTAFNISLFKGPIIVTGAYFFMYYCFLYGQAFSKLFLYFAAKTKADKDGQRVSLAEIKYNSKDRIARATDRTVGNTMEQMGPFLSSLWLHALFISPEQATFLGYAYIASRSIYPFTFYCGVPWILMSTIPGYAIIASLLGPVVYNALSS